MNSAVARPAWSTAGAGLRSLPGGTQHRISLGFHEEGGEEDAVPGRASWQDMLGPLGMNLLLGDLCPSYESVPHIRGMTGVGEMSLIPR